VNGFLTSHAVVIGINAYEVGDQLDANQSADGPEFAQLQYRPGLPGRLPLKKGIRSNVADPDAAGALTAANRIRSELSKREANYFDCSSLILEFAVTCDDIAARLPETTRQENVELVIRASSAKLAKAEAGCAQATGSTDRSGAERSI
jgi:hypothetical protein